MSTEAVPVTIQILDKEYMVSCPPDEREALLESAKLLNSRMREVRDGGKVLGTERMAVMTALNVIHEFSTQKSAQDGMITTTAAQLERLEIKISQAIPRRQA
jgi:cell division protein ZapA